MLSQNRIINKVLSTKDYSLISLNNLTAKYFFNYTTEFNFIVNHYKVYGVVPDKVTFINAFPEFELQEVSEPNTYLLEQLFKDYNTSYLASRFNTIKKMLENGDTDDAVQYFMSSTEEIHSGKPLTCIDLTKDTSRYEHYLEKTTNPTKYYLSTGFRELDKLIGGIDRENEDFVIASRPGVGKTQLLVKLAVSAALQGLTVGIVEGEMSEDKIGYRVDTLLGHLSNSAINRGDLYVQKAYKQYIDNLTSGLQQCGPIKVITQNSIPDGKITITALKSFIEAEKLDILFVDQYSLMELENTTARVPEFEKISYLAKGIKQLQVEKRIPIITISQMNRTKNDDGSQDTTQIALSDKIGQYATILVMLEQKENQDTNLPVQLTLNIVKSRDGGDHKKLNYGVNFNTGIWQYIPAEEDSVSTAEDFEEIEAHYTL